MSFNSFSRYSSYLSRNRRYEVFAAAAAASEAAKIGGQRRRFYGCYPQPNVGIQYAGATQGLINVVIDAGACLPFTIHRHVRLDACVPTCINVAPGRLLKLALTSMDRARREKRRKESRKERERERELI